MYGLLDKTTNQVGYATTTIHRMLSDLTFVLNGDGEFAGKNRNVVIGGDLNISIQFDEIYGKKARYTNAHKICFDRIEDFGLVNSFSKDYKGPVQTLRHNRSTIPWQNDYLFLSKNLAKSMQSCRVLDESTDKRISRFSDHNPVVIELDGEYF
jgi:exonuclease III